MALGRNYITLNGVSLPNPTAFSIKYQNIEQTGQTEDGHDVGTTTRLQKRVFNMSFNCTSRGEAVLREICDLTTCNMTYRGETIVVRPRIQNGKLVDGSEYLARTDGLYTVSIVCTEV